MNRLTVIEYQGQRVLTTAQLADSYGTDNRRISENFNANKIRYSEGKHFFALTGEEKRDFLNHTEIADGSKNASQLYLWTEKGAWLHAKSLNTDRAWEAYEALVDDYYNVKGQVPQLSGAELIAAIANQAVEQEKRMKLLENKVDVITNGLTATPDHAAIVAKVNEYARWSRTGHNEVYSRIYDIMQAKHGIDVRQRVNNERKRVDDEYFSRTGKRYKESTLKNKVNGIDIMVRMGVINLFHEILVGLLAIEIERSMPKE